MDAQPPRHEGSIRHVVHIRVDPEAGFAERDALEVDLRGLVAEHPHAIRASVHRDLDRRPGAPVSATWMSVFDFAGMADFELYLKSDAHTRFLSTHQPSMAYISAIQVPLEGFRQEW